MSIQQILELSKENRSEIESGGAAHCYFCLNTDIRYGDISQWCDHRETAICPHCSVDSLVSSDIIYDLIGNRTNPVSFLLQKRWEGWNWSKSNDLDNRQDLQTIVNKIIRHTPTPLDNDYSKELNDFLIWTDMWFTKQPISHGYQQWLIETLDDEIYNEWQCQTDGLTDGIKSDGDQHLAEYERHCQLSQSPEHFGELAYAEANIPIWTETSLEMTPERYQEIINRIVGEDAIHLNLLGWNCGPHYIDLAPVSEQLEPNTQDFPEQVFQVLASEDCLPLLVSRLKLHILSCLRQYQRDFYAEKARDVLVRYKPHQLVYLDYYLALYQGCEADLLYSLGQECFGEAIENLYRRHCPDKVGTAAIMLEKTATHTFIEDWASLYQQLKGKYEGVE